MVERPLLLAGAVLALGLIGVILNGGSSWHAWVAAAALATALPIGAIGWTLTMRLAVGDWTGPIAEACAAISGRAALAALLFAPILLHPGLYPWVGQHQQTAFRAVYLSPLFFDLRSLAGLTILGLGGLAIAARRVSKAAACIVIALFAGVTVLVTDWLASLDPSFNASGFGLYVITIQFASALALAILAGRPEETHRAGALLLTLMLLWAYFAFMQYFILWSGNLPAGMAWYHVRGQGIWPAVMWAIAGCRLPVGFALLFRTVRHSRRWMMALAGVVLTGSVLEFAWLALPGSGAGLLQGALYTVMALAAVALCWPPRAAIPDQGGAA